MAKAFFAEKTTRAANSIFILKKVFLNMALLLKAQ